MVDDMKQIVNNCVKTVSRILDQVVRILEKVANLLSYKIVFVAAAILTAMMLLVAASVFMRYLFNNPMLGDIELVEFMMVGLVSFSLAYCAVEKGHVAVTFVLEWVPYRAQAIINVLISLVNLGFVVMIAICSIQQAAVLWNRGSASIMLKLPLFLFPLVLTLGSAVFSLVLLVRFLDSLSGSLSKEVKK